MGDEEGPAVVSLKTDLLRTITSIKSSGKFAHLKRDTIFVNPGLEVAGSLIPLPLVVRDAEAIRASSQQASFGRGEETVVDTTVRNTWELDANQFRCSNPHWKPFVILLVREAAKNLGMPGNVRFEPYKLLLYEKGSFFKPHKDSEKVPGMIGTLVVCLPSRHEGGDVHLSHAAKKQKFVTSTASDHDLTTLSWYSDVTHEVKEITSGHRLVLTYNIIQAEGPKVLASLFLQQQSQLASLLTRWRTELPIIKRLVYRLEHKYSQNSLSLQGMKGRDSSRIQCLYDTCKENGFYLLLANMTKTQFVDEDEDQDVLDECFGNCLRLDYVCSYDGLQVTSGHEIEMRDILGEDPYTDRDPDSEVEAEFTGNASQPAEYRYRDSVAIMVPRDQFKQFIRRYGYANCVNMLRMVLRDLWGNLDDAGIRQFATNFMEMFLEGNLSLHDHIPALILKAACELKNESLYRKAITVSMGPRPIDHKRTGIFPPKTEVEQNVEFVLNRTRNILPTLVRICNTLFSPEKSDWDRLGQLVDSLPSIGHVSVVLETIGGLLEKDELKQSFAQWRSGIETERFDKEEPLGIDDLGFIRNVIDSHMDDEEWINNRLTPRLERCADRGLLYRLLLALSHSRKGEEFCRAYDIATRLLESLLPKLQLQLEDFLWPAARDIPNTVRSNPYGYKHNYENSTAALIMQYIDIFLKRDLIDGTTRLLECSCKNMTDVLARIPRDKVNPTDRDLLCGMSAIDIRSLQDLPIQFANRFLEDFLKAVERCQLSYLLSKEDSPVKRLVDMFLRRYIICDVPTVPSPAVGWSYRARGCKRGPYWKCERCEELNKFLVSSDQQTAEFKKPADWRQHVAAYLPPRLFRHSSGKSRGGGVYTLTVTKLSQNVEYRDDVEQYTKKVEALRQRLSPFARELVQQLLGDKLYRELVLLEQLRAPPVESADLESASAVPAAAPGVPPSAFGTVAPFGVAGPGYTPATHHATPNPLARHGVSGYGPAPASMAISTPGFSVCQAPYGHVPALSTAPITSTGPGQNPSYQGPGQGIPLNPNAFPYRTAPQFPVTQPPPTAQGTPVFVAGPPPQPQSMPGTTGAKRRADGTWEYPPTTRLRTDYVDLTGE